MATTTASRLFAASALLALTTIASIGGAGCSLVYRHSQRGETWVAHTDRSTEFLTRTNERIARVWSALDALFDVPAAKLDAATFLLDGTDDAVIDYGYAPELLGYYVPFLDLIAVDTGTALTHDDAGLEQVLCHELAHHFLAHAWPEITKSCWLNEGLAGNLEVTLASLDDRHEYPLLNPILFQLTRRHVKVDTSTPLLPDLLATDWATFHDPVDRERNYAIAWSIVYYVLEHSLDATLPLDERLRQLRALDPETIAALEPEWRRYFRERSLIDALVDLARDRRLDRQATASWAVDQLGSIRSLNGPRAIEALVTLSADVPSHDQRVPIWLSFLGVLARSPHAAFIAPRATQTGLASSLALVADASRPSDERCRVVAQIDSHSGAREFWGPTLVAALAEPDADLRAAAAQALARIATKPTMLNPAFWTDGPEDERAREIAEWREWLAAAAP